MWVKQSQLQLRLPSVAQGAVRVGTAYFSLFGSFWSQQPKRSKGATVCSQCPALSPIIFGPCREWGERLVSSGKHRMQEECAGPLMLWVLLLVVKPGAHSRFSSPFNFCVLSFDSSSTLWLPTSVMICLGLVVLSHAATLGDFGHGMQPSSFQHTDPDHIQLLYLHPPQCPKPRAQWGTFRSQGPA